MSNPTPTPCPHGPFDVDFDMARIKESGQRILEVSVQCTACGKHFHFQGMPSGAVDFMPTVTPDGRKARLPLFAEGEQPTVAQIVLGIADGLNG